MRGMGEIQFAPAQPPPPDPPYVPPHWLEVILNAVGKVLVWIGEHVLAPIGLGLSRGWNLLVLLVMIVGVAALGWLAWHLLLPAWRRWRARPAAVDADWTPAPAAALALLEDADRLAAEGRFADAVHLLLRRSVAEIATARPTLLAPSSTAREIAALPALPAAMRHAFATIADEVERARYALRLPGAAEWHRAREAYAAFAHESLGRAA